MKNIQKQIMLEELSLEAMATLKGGDHSHDLVMPVTPTENYGSGGPPPTRDSNDGDANG